MKPLVTHLLAGLLLLILIIYFPHVLIIPGELIGSHQEIRKDCLSCHAPFRGPSGERCISCHKPELIGVTTVSGNTIPGDEERIIFHQNLGSSDCMECHTDHAGLADSNATGKFSHGLLNASLKNECVFCHARQRPENLLHRRVAEDCALCHSIEGWRLGSFDHRRIMAGFENDCAACHQKDKPSDELHSQVEMCDQCHRNQAWKPATFEHDRYFRFDSHHPSDCKSCHTSAGKFSEYTCYSCHEHSPDRIAEKHRKEGIFNFENCAECHRSGDKDEAKKGTRRKERSKESEHEREHEGHD